MTEGAGYFTTKEEMTTPQETLQPASLKHPIPLRIDPYENKLRVEERRKELQDGKIDVDPAIDRCAGAVLTRATDDYASRIYEIIKEDVRADVRECVSYVESQGFTQGDVQLAIGRAICKRLGIEDMSCHPIDVWKPVPESFKNLT